MKNEEVLNGAYIKCWKIIKRGKDVENDHKWIKITEIKIIERLNGDACIFSTYKDCKFYTTISESELLKAVNKFIFKIDDYYYEYVET